MSLGSFRLCCKLGNLFFWHDPDFHKFTNNRTKHKQKQFLKTNRMKKQKQSTSKRN